jgi:hypothetical protein
MPSHFRLQASCRRMASFDLSSLSRDRAANQRGIRVLWAACAVAFAAMVVWIALVTASLLGRGPVDGTQWMVFVVLSAGFLFGIALCGFAFWKSGPGITRMDVASNGVRFIWPSGRAESLSWREMCRGVVLLDYSANAILVRSMNTLWEVRRWNRPASFLSREAFEEVGREAVRQEFALDSQVLKNANWGWSSPCQVTRIVDRTGSASEGSQS